MKENSSLSHESPVGASLLAKPFREQARSYDGVSANGKFAMKAGWKTVPMGQLCSIKSGKSDTKDAVEDGAYAFFDRSRTIKKSSRYLFDCEAMIIPGEGTEFLPKHFVGKFDLHQRAYALYNFSNQIDVKFLYYYLHHKSDYFPQVAVGATVKSLRLRHFEQLPVSLTSISEQQRIVGILDEAFDGSPPPPPTPKRTCKTPAPCSKATCNPSSPRLP